MPTTLEIVFTTEAEVTHAPTPEPVDDAADDKETDR